MKDASHIVLAVGGMSVAFGAIDFAFANYLAGKVGMKDGRIFRAAGLREIATGAGALAFPTSAIPLAARLAGDLGDIAVLGATAGKRNNPRAFAALIGVGIVAAVTAIDILALRRLALAKAKIEEGGATSSARSLKSNLYSG